MNTSKCLFLFGFLVYSPFGMGQVNMGTAPSNVELLASVDDEYSRVETRSFTKPIDAIKALINGDKISKELEQLLNNKQDRPKRPTPIKIYDDQLTPKSQI